MMEWLIEFAPFVVGRKHYFKGVPSLSHVLFLLLHLQGKFKGQKLVNLQMSVTLRPPDGIREIDQEPWCAAF